MRGWACLVLICHQQKRTFGGWERSRGGGIKTNTWHQPRDMASEEAGELGAAPDELDHACRKTRDFASHFRVSYDIFLFIMEAAKPVFSVCTDDGGCAY